MMTGRILRRGAFLWILMALGVPRPASAVLTVYIEPEGATVSVGELIDLSIRINDEVDTISNFQVIVQFDPTVLEVDSVLEGELYTSSGYQTFFHAGEESPGTWEIFEVIFPYTSFVQPPGELAVIRFHALAEGETAIDFVSAVVMDYDRVEIQPLASTGGHVIVSPVVGIAAAGARGSKWALGAPFPNPTRGGASVSFARPPGAGWADGRLSVYDARGRLVRRLGLPSSGVFAEIVWDGRNERAEEVPSGLYFFRLETGEESLHRKVTIVR